MRVALTLVLACGARRRLLRSGRVAEADRLRRRPRSDAQRRDLSVRSGHWKTHDISRSLANDSGPAVSPDGKWIAFGSTRSGMLGLYVARLDGSDVRLVKQFHHGLSTLAVTWSPDGTRIAATSTCCALTDELWLGNVSGIGVTRWDAEGSTLPSGLPTGGTTRTSRTTLCRTTRS